MVIEIMMWFCCGHHVQDGQTWSSTCLTLNQPTASNQPFCHNTNGNLPCQIGCRRVDSSSQRLRMVVALHTQVTIHSVVLPQYQITPTVCMTRGCDFLLVFSRQLLVLNRPGLVQHTAVRVQSPKNSFTITNIQLHPLSHYATIPHTLLHATICFDISNQWSLMDVMQTSPCRRQFLRPCNGRQHTTT